jgi:hypothetical protein
MGGSGVILTTIVDSGTTSGSGWVAVVPVERGDQGASNGMILNVAVAVLAELSVILKGVAVDVSGRL